MSQIRFDPIKHEYTRGGRKLPSVTTVLAAANLVDTNWCSGTEFLDRGTMIHDLTARRDRGEKVDMRKVPRRWRGCMDAWELYKADTNIEMLAIEQPVGCELYAGTFDREVLYPRATLTTMLDLKCSKTGGPGDWVKYQLVAYCHAYKPKVMFGRAAVTLREDGTYKSKHWGPETGFHGR